MSSTFGWLISVLVTCMSFIVWSAGEPYMYLEPTGIIVTLGFIYGLTIVSFGLEKTRNSILSLKYLFLNTSSSSEELSHVYKTQMMFSFITGGISTLLGLIALGSNIDSAAVLGPALSVITISLLYPLVISGLVYYPLYKKLA